ncbi:hypothetical protein BACCOPRO_02907 [Phocaeicola coprophilus DSM 18228 = JCM 13818]|uniref:Uncharacterized protein n=1 Tax=Phocaeicola coprophilus DSM 18228 = JCM 13818 TaxID=547042 RepID=S0FB96_9BACT|nr:hypothetical protein BACCOPRO_02907 [Phocaeicola coprophilus DSM 18228 = JCM 13818]
MIVSLKFRICLWIMTGISGIFYRTEKFFRIFSNSSHIFVLRFN